MTDEMMTCKIRAYRKSLYFIFVSEIILSTCIWTLNPPNEMIAVMRMVLKIYEVFSEEAKITPPVISKIQEFIYLIIVGRFIVEIILLIIKKLVMIPSSRVRVEIAS